ncbi:hypothetical protein LIER_12388 [Lithospermum erythrorhizon]|uniref:Uncharacterized protein n=1 Tax=Lithospermum erythrorhizon TaxID=34254 RepID=A0AAV3PT19_LITER
MYVGRGSSVVLRLISFNSSTVVLTCSSNHGGRSIASSGCASPPSTVMWSVAFAPSTWPLGCRRVIAPFLRGYGIGCWLGVFALSALAGGMRLPFKRSGIIAF